MAIRTSLLSTRNINLDTDFSKYIETVSEPGVIEGFALANSKIGLGKARVPCERTNGETIYALVQNFNEVSISGNGYVIISISQTIIDDGSLGNEDGTGIATVEVVSELPSKNYLELYEISELGLITDKRNMIKKVGELNTAIETLQSQVNDIDERVEALETAGAIDHLEEQGLVGELYTLSNTMFNQKTPKLSECTLDNCKVGNTNDNKEIHIQRIASGQASDTLKLKVKAVGSPTTALKVEVRSGIQVTVTENSKAYWYGDDEDILATGSIAYSDITTSWQEIEVELDNAVGGNKGDLLNIVCYQESSGSVVVNTNNYYILACDSTQWSEAFSFVSVNGSTRTRSFLMPYCIGDGFEQSLLVKIGGTINVQQTLLDEPAEKANTDGTTPDTGAGRTYTYGFTVEAKNAGQYTVSFESKQVAGSSTSLSSASEAYYILVDDEVIEHLTFTENSWTSHSYTLTLDKPGTITYKCVGRVNVNNNPYNIWYYTRNLKIISYNLSKNTIQKKELPREEKVLGEKTAATLFGRHIDGEWFAD